LVGVQECYGGWEKLKSYFPGTHDYLELLSVDGPLCTLYNPERFDLLSYGGGSFGPAGCGCYSPYAYGRLLDKESGETFFFINQHWNHLRRDPYGHVQNVKSLIESNSAPGDSFIVVGDFNQNLYGSFFGEVFEGQLGLRREEVDGVDAIWSSHRGSSVCSSPDDNSGGRGSDHNPVYCELSLCADCPVVPQNVYRKVSGVGSWGGWCTCPDGQRYNVGDRNDACENGPNSLACVGGEPGECVEVNDNSRDGMQVTCAIATGMRWPMWLASL